jgi:hypothetical protein
VSEPPPPRLRPEFALDPRQREIRELLELIGPEPASYFSDACRIMDGAAGVTAQTHLAAHLLREIEGRLLEVIELVSPETSDADRDEASHRAKITAAASTLGLDAPTTEQWIEYALPLHRFAHRYSLAGARDVAEFRAHFASGQSVLLAVLRAFRALYVNARPVLIELAAVLRPTREHLKQLSRRVLHSPVALGEFFSLATLSWFPLLREADYFRNPRPVEIDEEGRLSHVEWPPARFLVRAAAVGEFQEQVVEILAGLDTNNPEARDATVEAALAMRPALAARLAPRIAAYAAEAESWWIPRHAEELVTHLMVGGETAAALEVTKPLLAEAPRGSDWRMRHAFADLVPKLFPAAGLDGLILLRGLLADDLSSDGRLGRNDLSTIWRDSIAGGHDFQRRDLLVTALNTAAETLVADDPMLLREVVDALTTDERAIFSRLALHLMARHPDPALTAEWLGREEVFRDHNLTREYAELAEQSFRSLPVEVKERIFGWIEAGPTWRPEDLREEEIPLYEDGWQLRKLRSLPELPEVWRQRYDELVERLGAPDDPLAPQTSAIWSGTRSPASKDELLQLADDELLEFLDTWRPGEDWHGPSVEGLAHQLREASVEAPGRFSHLLPRLAGREPTYVRHVVSGLQQVASNGTGDIEWAAILQFAGAIVGLPGRIEGRDPHGDELDPRWDRSRLEVARLLVSGLARRSLPAELAGELWPVIAALAEDQDPTIETAQRNFADDGDAELLAHNSTRPTAVEAVIRFAWWLHEHEAADGREAEQTLPVNVRELLERHLSPEQEPTNAVASVFGRYFNLLYGLDPAWTTEQSAAIFPDDPALTDRRDAAWSAFIGANRFWQESWDVLEPQYRRGVEELADPRFADEEVSLFDLTGALLMHVLFAYFDGLADLSDESLLGRFFAVAPLRLRRSFFEMIGTDISGDEEVPAETLEKLRRLWEWRSGIVLANGNTSELAGFGWWFGSGKFASRWASEQLIRVLEAGGGVSFDYTVTQRLPETAATDLPSAVRIVSLLIERAYTPHLVLSGRDQFRTVLAAALASDDDRLAAEARATISRLYTERHTEFNDLLA